MRLYTYLPIHACIHMYTHMHTHIHSSSRLFTPTTTGDEEEAPSGRSRLYVRPLCAVWPRMGNEGIGGMRSLDTEPTPDVAKQNMAPRDNPASAKRTQESAQCICITPQYLPSHAKISVFVRAKAY